MTARSYECSNADIVGVESHSKHGCVFVFFLRRLFYVNKGLVIDRSPV
jgi:hypothetical protein